MFCLLTSSSHEHHEYIVKPVLIDHLWDNEKVAF